MMRRASFAAVVAIGLLLPWPTGAAGIQAALRNSDGATTGNGLSIQSSAAISDLTTATVWVWVRPDNVNNTLRNIAGKSVSGPGGWEWFKRGVDGTQLQLSRYRAAGTPLTIQSPTGTLKANVPQFIAVSWDLSSSANCKMWAGTLDIPAVQLSPTVSLGSGSPASDVAQALIVAQAVSGSAGWPGVVWSLGMSSANDFTLEEVRRQQYAPNPRTVRKCAGMWVFNGQPVRDLCGNGNHGTLIGTGRLSPDYLPRVQFGFRRSL